MAKKRLKDLKKSKDVYFRRRAKLQALAPTTDLNLEMRQKVKTIKGTKKQVQSQKNKIKSLEKKNRSIRKNAIELEKRYEFEDEEGKKQIETQLNSPDFKTLNLSDEKNKLRALEGKDFYFKVDDGFKIYNINTKDLKKYWRKGKDASIVILKKMKKNASESIDYYNKIIQKEKNTASKERLKKLNNIKNGLEKKLKYTIDKNIDAVESGDLSELDEISDEDEKAYSLLFKVVDTKIDRIGI